MTAIISNLSRVIRHWILSYEISSSEIEIISSIAPGKRPEMIFNMGQDFNFYRFKNHKNFLIQEYIILGQVFDFIFHYLVMVPDFENI